MAQAGIKMHGFRELGVLLQRLPDESRKKAIRPALRDSIRRVRSAVSVKFSGEPVGVVTGAIWFALVMAKVRSTSKRGVIRYTVARPTDKQDAIAVNALEYGWTDRFGYRHRARSPYRTAVDENAHRELFLIRMDISRGIEKQAKKLGVLK